MTCVLCPADSHHWQVEYFTRRRLQVSQRCQKYDVGGEAFHRRSIEEVRELSEIGRQCHYLMTDSVAFRCGRHLLLQRCAKHIGAMNLVVVATLLKPTGT